jgi:hypothetical protein
VIPAALWLRGFALTIATEQLVAVPLLRRVEPSLPRRMGAVLIANAASYLLGLVAVPLGLFH